MSYLPSETFASLLCDYVKIHVPDLRGVTYAVISNHKQLMQSAATVSGSPKAVICQGACRYANHGLTRTSRCAIVVFIPFQPGQNGVAKRILDSIAQLFIPSAVLGEGALVAEIDNWSAIETDAQTLSYALTVNVVEHA